MKINVKHVAKLANLPLTPDEEEKYSQQLSRVLDYIEQLNKVDTTNVEPTYNVTGLSTVMRPDKEGKCLTQEDAISNAVNKKDGLIVTRGVFEE